MSIIIVAAIVAECVSVFRNRAQIATWTDRDDNDMMRAGW